MMAHPYKGKSHHSSRAKMHALTGHSGGGHAHAGGSHFKRAKGAHAEIASEHPSRRKSGGHVPGAAAKPRLDKFAKGGRTKGKGHNTTVNIVMPQGHGGAGAGPGPMPKPPMPPPMGGPPPGGPPPGGAPGGGLGALGAMGGQAGQQALGALAGGTGSNPLAGLSKGFKKGGRAKVVHGDPMPNIASRTEAAAFDRDGSKGYQPVGDKHGGRAKKAWGGAAKPKPGEASPGGFPPVRPPPPPIPPTGPVQRASGGGVNIGQRGYHSKSVGTAENGDHLDHWKGYAHSNRSEYTPPYPRVKKGEEMKSGGRAKLTAGAATGVGRLEQSKIEAKRHK